MSGYKYPWMKREAERQAIKDAAAKKGLKARSQKLSIKEKIYAVLSKDFLADHPVCQCGRMGCTGRATQVHHKKGRGAWLNVVEFFLAVCDSCHRWIEMNPEAAKAGGYSLRRVD